MSWFKKEKKRDVPSYDDVVTRTTTTHDVSKDEAILMLIGEVGALRQNVQVLQGELTNLQEKVRKITS